MLTAVLAFTVKLVVQVALQPLVRVTVTVKLYPPAVTLLNVASLVVLVKLPPLLDQL